MGMHQSFQFTHASQEEVRRFLRSLGAVASIDDRSEFFVFSQWPGQPAFTFDCELTEDGFKSERAGKYFEFLGVLVEGLTGHFGPVRIEDA